MDKNDTNTRRREAIARDNAGWWLRELAVANFIRDTLYAQAIARRVSEICAKFRGKA